MSSIESTDTVTTTVPVGRAQRGRHVVMAITSVALLMSSVDGTSVATAIPTLQHELNAPLTWTTWTITAYALGQIIALPIAGRLSDQFGRKRIFIAAVVLFTISSLLCALSANIYALIAFRVLQAFGGGAFMPSAVGMVSDVYGRNRDRAIGLFSSIVPIGGLVGPLIGGALLTLWSWRAIFTINLPLGVAVLAVGAWLLPRSVPATGMRHRLDILGIALFAFGLLALMLAISALGTDGPTLIGFVLPLAVGVLLLALFIWRCAVARHPFVPLRLLKRRELAFMNLINALSGSATLGFASLMALYAVERYDLSSIGAGAMLTARAVGTIVIAAVAALSIRRTGYRWPLRLGFLLTGCGFIGIAVAPPGGVDPTLWLAACAVVIGVGMGISIPSNNNAGLQLAPADAAAITGIRGMSRQIGGIVTVSVVAACSAASGDPAASEAWAFVVLGVILLALIPLVSLVPERPPRLA